MYIETSLPQRPRNLASLISPLLNSQNTDTCLRFYYHATGEGDIGSLRVIFKLEGLSSLVELFRVTGNNDDRWIPVNIDIPASSTGFADFEVIFPLYYKQFSVEEHHFPFIAMMSSKKMIYLFWVWLLSLLVCLFVVFDGCQFCYLF